MESAGLQELCDYRVLITSLIATISVMALLARRMIRRPNTARRSEMEVRAWSYCPKCGWKRGRQDDMDQSGDTRCLPSELLRRGWCRESALDADGLVVSPNDPTAVAWSIWGAMSRAFDSESVLWETSTEHLHWVLQLRYGGTVGSKPITTLRWNRATSRTKPEVVGVAMEVERLMGLTAPNPPRT